jgi:ATP-dependent exoDNAse (exonuclease V) beta subunit
MMSGKNWKEGHKYWGMTAKQIKSQWSNNKDNVSGAGTKLHYDIECFMNNSKLPKGYTHKDLLDYYNANIQLFENTSIEWKYFIQFVKDHPDLKPYRTEWMVYNEDVKLAGSIDMVYENPDGKLSIYDWKRSKEITKVNNYEKYGITDCVSHLPDSNFWHYALQLNTYKEMLEQKYGKKVSGLYLVRLHPEAEEQTYELLKVPVLKAEIKDLFKLKKSQL